MAAAALLEGLDEIADHLRLRARTTAELEARRKRVAGFIRREGLPAVQRGGRWYADPDAVLAWWSKSSRAPLPRLPTDRRAFPQTAKKGARGGFR